MSKVMKVLAKIVAVVLLVKKLVKLGVTVYNAYKDRNVTPEEKAEIIEDVKEVLDKSDKVLGEPISIHYDPDKDSNVFSGNVFREPTPNDDSD